MQPKPALTMICLITLILIAGNILPTAAQSLSYSDELIPNTFSAPLVQWRITNVTSEVVEFGWGTGSFWQASPNQVLVFDIHRVTNNEVHGVFTIGNLTLPANDSRIAAELAFSIWPWFPGLISHLDWSTVDQNATNAATGFMDGTLEIRTTPTTKTYIYHQGVYGNQNTTLIYDLQNGILRHL